MFRPPVNGSLAAGIFGLVSLDVNPIASQVCLSEAKLAMPAISTGVYGYPAEEAVPIIVKAANETLDKLKSIEETRFVVTNNLMLALFKNALQSK